MIGELLLLFGVAIILYTYYKLSTENARYFAERNLKCVSTTDAIRGIFSLFLGGMDFFQMTQKSYNRFPDES